jgi:hypothetical protein
VSICEVLTRVAVSVGTALGTLIRFGHRDDGRCGKLTMTTARPIHGIQAVDLMSAS